jgi:hypothetical protein
MNSTQFIQSMQIAVGLLIVVLLAISTGVQP